MTLHLHADFGKDASAARQMAVAAPGPDRPARPCRGNCPDCPARRALGALLDATRSRPVDLREV